MRKLAIVALMAAIGATARGQQPSAPSPNPDRNFIGNWTGTILLDADHDPSPVHLTVTEIPGGAGMVWQYAFGIKGQKGYKTPLKRVLLSVQEGLLLQQWDRESGQTLTATGLDEFARKGYGAFTATTDQHRSGFLLPKFTEDRVTFELEPDTMTYLWKVTTNGKTKVYSHFVFARDAITNSTKSNGH